MDYKKALDISHERADQASRRIFRRFSVKVFIGTAATVNNIST